MLWLHDDEWTDVGRASTLHHAERQWIYPFASAIDKPNPLPPIPDGQTMIVVKRDSCPGHIPIPEGAVAHQGYGPGEGIEVG